jgi:hypothetical protein
VLSAAALVACAQGNSPAPKTPPTASAPSPNDASTGTVAPAQEPSPSSRPADAEVDANYYRVRAAALQHEEPGDLARTDFVRFRRGRMYASGAVATDEEAALHRELTRLMTREGAAPLSEERKAALLDVTARLIALDPADIRGHMLRAAALRGLQRLPEANFHGAFGAGLLGSMMDAADGASFETAWTAFSVKEEYDVLRALGCSPERQAMVKHGQRSFDVLDARHLESGEAKRLYFDVTELFAEEGRSSRARAER